MPKVNSINTPIEELELDAELQEQFDTYFYNVPFIRALTSPNRKRAKDLPRDEEGKIIVDLEHPHILENMDYFRKAAITFEKTGKYTELKPNKNPNSEYYKWVKEEIRRCHEGLIRHSDGEWIPGNLYFFLNYSEMQRPIKVALGKNKKKVPLRMYKMPEVWDGTYWWYHYKHQAREEGLHCCMLASRGKGKSYNAASDLCKIFKLGETIYNNRGCTCYITASDKSYLVKGDQTLDKFQHNIDFISQNTEWAGRQMLVNRLQDMIWTAGYKDLDLGNRGTGNSVVGISSNNDVQKLRGTRAVEYLLEEAGTFPDLDKVWANILPSVEQGQGEDREVYGQIIMYGTAADKNSDFASMAKMMYHPEGFHIKPLNNIYDIEGKGGKMFSFFFAAYLNNSGCYDKDGNSNVTKALAAIIKDRAFVKKKTNNDMTAVSKNIAEHPITPQEAIMRTRGSFLPISLINERINQLESNENEWNDTYVGTLFMEPNGEVRFKPTDDEVITQFPLRDNKATGALQIFKMPEKINGNISSDRYIIGHDPVNQDEADSMSLSSTFVLDLYTESIVAEYTGRKEFQDESFELLRLLGIFYNAQILYESNNKMCYAYFNKMNCTYMLADTPEYLRERDIVKKTGYGNSSKGVAATAMLNKHEDELLRDWLLMPKTKVEKNQQGEEIETSIPNIMTIRNIALLRELSQYAPDINVDRVRALGVTMILRNSLIIQYNGDIRGKEEDDSYSIYKDDFFTRNYY